MVFKLKPHKVGGKTAQQKRKTMARANYNKRRGIEGDKYVKPTKQTKAAAPKPKPKATAAKPTAKPKAKPSTARPKARPSKGGAIPSSAGPIPRVQDAKTKPAKKGGVPKGIAESNRRRREKKGKG